MINPSLRVDLTNSADVSFVVFLMLQRRGASPWNPKVFFCFLFSVLFKYLVIDLFALFIVWRGE